MDRHFRPLQPLCDGEERFLQMNGIKGVEKGVVKMKIFNRLFNELLLNLEFSDGMGSTLRR